MRSFLAVAALACCAHAVNPSIQAAVTQKGIDYALDIAVPIIVGHMSNLTIATLPFSKDSIEGSISAIHCDDVKIGNVSLAVNSGDSVKLAINDLGVQCTANWRYKEKHWPHIPHGHGSADIVLSKSSADLGITLSAVEGKPHVAAGNCAATIDISHLHFHGGLSGWILNLATSLLKHHIEGAIDKAVCSAVTTAVNTDANAIMSRFTPLVPVPAKAPYNIAEIDFSLSSLPSGRDFIGAELHGEMYRIGAHSEAPFPAPAVPALSPSVNSHMLELALSPYVLESAAYVYQEAGLVQFLLRAEDVPPAVLFKLSTTTFEDWAPGMYKQYPDMPMALGISAAGKAEVAVNASGAGISWPLNMTFEVETKSELVEVFQITCTFEGGLDATINNTDHKIMPKLTYLACPAVLDWTKTGPVAIDMINAFVSAILGSIGLNELNLALAGGIPLPVVDGITFVNGDIVYGNGYIQALLDCEYEAPKKVMSIQALPAATLRGSTM